MAYKVEPENLDALDNIDLARVAKLERGDAPMPYIRYARLSCAARACRLAGDVDSALVWDRWASSVFHKIPESWQW